MDLQNGGIRDNIETLLTNHLIDSNAMIIQYLALHDTIKNMKPVTKRNCEFYALILEPVPGSWGH